MCNCLCCLVNQNDTQYFTVTFFNLLNYFILLLICSCWRHVHPFISALMLQAVCFRDIATDTVQLSRQCRRDFCHISISCCFYGLPVQPFYVVPPCARIVTFQTRKHFWKWHIFSFPDVKCCEQYVVWNLVEFCGLFQNVRPSLQLLYIINICKQYANGKCCENVLKLMRPAHTAAALSIVCVYHRETRSHTALQMCFLDSAAYIGI